MKSKARSARYTPTDEYLAMLKRLVRAAGERVGHADPDDLAALAAIGQELERAMVLAIAGLRADGFTWESIGTALGVTRQGALMKWGPLIAALADDE